MLSLDQLSIRFAGDEIVFFLNRGRDILALIGALYATKLFLKVSYSCFNVIKVYVLPKLWYTRDFKSKYGSWAVVTGASEGIGKSYALELAKRKMNVVLISRSYSKLEKVAAEIMNKYKVKTKLITADLNLLESYDQIEAELKDLEVGVLVNNVGIMYDRLQYFLTVESERLKQIINLNIMSTVLMTRLLLPNMVQREKGAIINVSSGSCVQPTPCMTAYSAAKKYVDVFSQALNYEYGSKGIVIQSVQPFYVSTRMTKFIQPNLFVPSADSYVDHALRTLSWTARTHGYWSHGLMGFVGSLMPQWLFFWSSTRLNLPLWNFLTGSTSEKLSKTE